MATLYDIISELRRKHQTPAAAKTLDLVVSELGQTRDNLRLALSRLEERPIPTGGRAVLEELAARARQGRLLITFHKSMEARYTAHLERFGLAVRPHAGESHVVLETGSPAPRR